ncbi:PQQ-binding-like beta-propeller repeat protein [Sinomonas sp. ASV322]|uniref:outer membrane protein assembly factor BamB family protein n=1 Tax=Sinomonas sp. ASV322 TaxID=3041920 RepID=UPI0027DDB832|nr:PQQ-binding-like beta-propeller repeat protein [Sinomonas sp. ASV322]MDQ4501509.1 PQQ-binding-like beta-propeller repeat protein [Sinomonas sp. ASV322]
MTRTRPRRAGRPVRLAAAVACFVAACAGLAACTGPTTAGPTPAFPPTPPAPLTAAPGSRTPGPLEPDDWPTYHRDPARTGAGPASPALDTLGQLRSAWHARLDGAVYAEPLVVRGRVIAATEANTVYALDATNGQVVWQRNLGAPMRASALPCGNIDPLGITGTPVYDAATDLVFAVGELSDGRHELVGVDAGDGSLVVRREVEPPHGDRIAYQQRAALALLNDRIYIAYGGLYGDCADYTGTVLSVPTTGGGPIEAYVVPTRRQGGIWAPGGPTVDGSRLLVGVGNGSSTTDYDGSDSLLALSASLERIDFFAPSTWRQDNAGDADLGSLTPVRVGPYVFADGKSGTAYLLDAGHFGGIGGALAQASVCRAFGAPAVTDMTLYVPCRGGLQQVTAVSPAGIHLGWRLPVRAAGSPVTGYGAVWVVDYETGDLYALDPASGSVRQHAQLGPVPHFATPTLSGGRVFVGTLDGVVALAAG